VFDATDFQVTSEAYSSPSIVLAASQHDGSRIIFDDFREAYYWLRQNTPEDAKVMSWWDYGYQITAMANRTILVDNNTWNNTHISRVGQVSTVFYCFLFSSSSFPCKGHVIPRGQGLRNYEGTGCELRAGYIRRAHWLCF